MVICLVLCLGHKFGTECYFRTRYPERKPNWEKWQLCVTCARKLHPEFYKNIKNHGVTTRYQPQKYKGTFGIE